MSSASKKRKAKGDHMWFRSGKELKNTNKCRGLHFYNSVNRRLNKQLTDEDILDINMIMDPFYFENFCMTCDNFPGDAANEPSPFAFRPCPRKDKINAFTNWREFDCPYFYD